MSEDCQSLSKSKSNIFVHNGLNIISAKHMQQLFPFCRHLVLTEDFTHHTDEIKQFRAELNGSLTEQQIDYLALNEKDTDLMIKIFYEFDKEDVEKNIFLNCIHLNDAVECKNMVDIAVNEWHDELQHSVQDASTFVNNLMQGLDADHHEVKFIHLLPYCEAEHSDLSCNHMIHSLMKRMNESLLDKYQDKNFSSEILRHAFDSISIRQIINRF